VGQMFRVQLWSSLCAAPPAPRFSLSLARSLARSLALSLARSLALSLSRPLALSLSRSLARSPPPVPNVGAPTSLSPIPALLWRNIFNVSFVIGHILAPLAYHSIPLFHPSGNRGDSRQAHDTPKLNYATLLRESELFICTPFSNLYTATLLS